MESCNYTCVRRNFVFREEGTTINFERLRTFADASINASPSCENEIARSDLRAIPPSIQLAPNGLLSGAFTQSHFRFTMCV